MINSDWHFTAKPSEAETQLKDFHFKGPGWYFTEKDTLLAVPADRDILKWWHQVVRPDEHFTFYIWNSSDPTPVFNAIADAPTKQDSRPKF